MNLNRYLALIFFVLFSFFNISVSHGITETKVYKNCSALNKDYPGGVALPGAKNKGGKTKKIPIYDKNLYEMNKKSDRDKDGIACEK